MRVSSSFTIKPYNPMSSKRSISRLIDPPFSPLVLFSRAGGSRVSNPLCKPARIGKHAWEAFLSESQGPSCLSGCPQFGLQQTCRSTPSRRVGKYQDGLYEIHKREVSAHNFGYIICTLGQVVPFSLAECRPVFSYNEMNHEVLLNPSYVDLSCICCIPFRRWLLTSNIIFAPVFRTWWPIVMPPGRRCSQICSVIHRVKGHW